MAHAAFFSHVLPSSDIQGSPASPVPHPAVWRASQISQGVGRFVDTGHAALSAELPGKGWPCGALIELLLEQSGIGELTLLQPALSALPGNGSVVLIQPPHMPNVAAWNAWGMDSGRLLWVRPQTMADALWAADQALKSDSCSALLCWLPQVPANALRRLNSAAQAGNTLFVALRPGSAAQHTSPAPLRLALQPAPGGLLVNFIKRRGPLRELPLHVPLFSASSSFFAPFSHAFMDGRSPLPDKSGHLSSVPVG